MRYQSHLSFEYISLPSTYVEDLLLIADFQQRQEFGCNLMQSYDVNIEDLFELLGWYSFRSTRRKCLDASIVDEYIEALRAKFRFNLDHGLVHTVRVVDGCDNVYDPIRMSTKHAVQRGAVVTSSKYNDLADLGSQELQESFVNSSTILRDAQVMIYEAMSSYRMPG